MPRPDIADAIGDVDQTLSFEDRAADPWLRKEWSPEGVESRRELSPQVPPASEELFDVEIALRMPAAGRVGVSEFVDQRELRPARKHSVDIHFVEHWPR